MKRKKYKAKSSAVKGLYLVGYPGPHGAFVVMGVVDDAGWAFRRAGYLNALAYYAKGRIPDNPRLN